MNTRMTVIITYIRIRANYKVFILLYIIYDTKIFNGEKLQQVPRFTCISPKTPKGSLQSYNLVDTEFIP